MRCSGVSSTTTRKTRGWRALRHGANPRSCVRLRRRGRAGLPAILPPPRSAPQSRHRPPPRGYAKSETAASSPTLETTSGVVWPLTTSRSRTRKICDEIGAGRHVGREVERRAEQPLAEKGDLDRRVAEQPGAAAARSISASAKRVARSALTPARLGFQLQIAEADAVERGGPGDSMSSTAGSRRRRKSSAHWEGHRLGVDPDAGDLALAPDRHLALGPAHHRDDVAGPVGRAEQHDRGRR